MGKETIEDKIAEGKIAAASTNATKALVQHTRARARANMRLKGYV
jgi:hypothetical protein